MVLLQPSKMGKIASAGHHVYGQEPQVAQELLALRMSCLPLILAAPSNRCAKAWQMLWWTMSLRQSKAGRLNPQVLKKLF
jgi:hypothetical protein